jgi:RNA polymerase sigma-70 factor (ECF subfamily)
MPSHSGLTAAFKDAQAAWPGVGLEETEFARAVTERAAGDDLAELQTSDLYLATACARGDARAHQLFEAELLSKVPTFLSRLRLPAFLVDEVRQRLRETLLMPGGLSGYSGRGALSSWLRVVTVRTALRLQRELQPENAEAGAPEPAGPAGPELEYLKSRYRGEYERALHEALQSLSDRERLFLRLHYADGLSIDRIGALYRLHRSTVARRLAAHRRKLLEGTRGRLQERIKLTVRSQLVVSVRSALQPK